jgi:hypothetical protein
MGRTPTSASALHPCLELVSGMMAKRRLPPPPVPGFGLLCLLSHSGLMTRRDYIGGAADTEGTRLGDSRLEAVAAQKLIMAATWPHLVTLQSQVGASGNRRGKGSCWVFNARWSRTAFRCATTSTWSFLRVCSTDINTPRVYAPASDCEPKLNNKKGLFGTTLCLHLEWFVSYSLANISSIPGKPLNFNIYNPKSAEERTRTSTRLTRTRP